MTKRKVALVGTCPSSRLLAPFNDPSWEIWACGPDNAGPGGLPRVDRWFEVHNDLGFVGEPAMQLTYIEWLRQQAFPIVSDRRDLFPDAIPTDIKKLIGVFGNFITSSPAYMVGKGILEGVREFALFGLDMSSREEYLVQRPGMHHVMWVAEHQFGATFTAPLESDILQPLPTYGRDLATPLGRKLEVRRKEILARIAALDADAERIKMERAHLAGAADNLDYVQSIWTGERESAMNEPIRLVATEDRKVVNLKENP